MRDIYAGRWLHQASRDAFRTNGGIGAFILTSIALPVGAFVLSQAQAAPRDESVTWNDTWPYLAMAMLLFAATFAAFLVLAPSRIAARDAEKHREEVIELRRDVGRLGNELAQHQRVTLTLEGVTMPLSTSARKRRGLLQDWSQLVKPQYRGTTLLDARASPVIEVPAPRLHQIPPEQLDRVTGQSETPFRSQTHDSAEDVPQS